MIDLNVPGEQGTALRSGQIFQMHKEYENAIIEYNKHLKVDPIDTYTYFYIGDCYFKLENYSEALQNYEKAILMGNNNLSSSTLYYYGISLCYERQHEKAIIISERLIKIDSFLGNTLKSDIDRDLKRYVDS